MLAKLRGCFSASRRVLLIVVFVVFGLTSSSRTMSTEFPTTLQGFGYAFNDAGQLRQINPEDKSLTDLPFKFDVSGNHSYNQSRYEALGEAVTEHVYEMLIEIGLHKIDIQSHGEKSSFVFATKIDFKDTKKLLFLIHGSGVVRAGQWSRSLIINHSTDHGTQIPYIKRAIDLGYDVLVTNTNDDYSPETHIVNVWEQLIAPALDNIESFAVVAHSYGGIVPTTMTKKYSEAFLEKCSAVAFTDSVHSFGGLPKGMLEWFRSNARNFVTSSEPLNTDLETTRADIPCFSAGHTKHEWTSWACIDVLFPFLEERYAQFLKIKSKNMNNSRNEDL